MPPTFQLINLIWLDPWGSGSGSGVPANVKTHSTKKAGEKESVTTIKLGKKSNYLIEPRCKCGKSRRRLHSCVPLNYRGPTSLSWRYGVSYSTLAHSHHPTPTAIKYLTLVRHKISWRQWDIFFRRPRGYRNSNCRRESNAHISGPILQFFFLFRWVGDAIFQGKI